MTTHQRQAFIDWMKALGMLLIVIGHVIGSPDHMFNEMTQPIYTKQLGVAFFIFIMGWSLANDRGSWLKVVFNRLFPVYFYGIAMALIMSVINWFAIGDISESNYLPFFAGVNVLFDFFPANPSTWYIGTYLHVLLFWALILRHVKLTPWLMLAGMIFEIGFRAVLISLDIQTIAYMVLPNWLSVFLLGYWFASSRDQGISLAAGGLFGVWALLLTVWALFFNGLDLDAGFPFRSVPHERTGLTIALQSGVISLVYFVNTWLCFQLCRRLWASALIALIARNTLLVFIIHMPVIYGFSNAFYSLFEHRETAQIVWIVVVFVGLTLLSEVITRTLRITVIRDALWKFLSPWLEKLPFNTGQPLHKDRT